MVQERIVRLVLVLLPPMAIAVGVAATVHGDLLPSLPRGLMEMGPWLAALLGAGLALAYGRTRVLILIGLVLAVYLGSVFQIRPMAYEEAGDPAPALGYALLTFLVPLIAVANAFWSERYHILMDLGLRLLAFGACAGLGVVLIRQYPDAAEAFLLTLHWPALHWPGLRMPQVSTWSLLAGLVITGVALVRGPRPFWAAQWVGLLGIGWMLPWLFHEYALPLATTGILLILSLAVIQESFQMAFRDDLTGLPGRRALNERLQRLGRRYAIAMTDVDHFKKFNDTHGHDLGDQVLRVVASQLRRVGGGGRAYRYGGEEFTIVFPGRRAEQCVPYLEAVREAIQDYDIVIRDEKNRPEDRREGRARRGQGRGQTVSVTISMGVAERDATHSDPEAVIKAADQALYQAKE
ncbi:MAG: diguanylate cyclase, partial [Ectothiorhodospira sp.]